MPAKLPNVHGELRSLRRIGDDWHYNRGSEQEVIDRLGQRVALQIQAGSRREMAQR